MNYRTTLLLVAMLIVVGAVIYFTSRESTEKAETPAEKRLLAIDSADVSKVVITPQEGKPTIFEKQDGKWRITEPVKAAAQSFAVDDLLRALTDLKSRGQVSKDAKTGLDQPRYKLEIVGKNKTVKLAVGNRSQVGDHLYVLPEGESKPQVVAADLDTQLAKPLNDYRDMRLVDASSTDIRQVTITRGGEKLSLVKEGASWSMTSPSPIPLDGNQMQDLINAITGLRAAEFLDAPGSASSYQLDNPKVAVWFSQQEPSTQPASTQPAPAGTTIRFGRYDDILKKNLYAQVSPGDAIVKVAASTLDEFNKTPLDLRDRKVLDIDPAKIQRIAIRRELSATTQPTTRPASTEQWVLERRKFTTTAPVTMPWLNALATKPATAMAATMPTTVATTQATTERWVFADEHQGTVDDSKISSLLGDLHPLRAEKYHEKAPPAEPAERITVRVTTNAPSGNEIKLYFWQDGENAQPQGQYNDLIFDIGRLTLGNFRGDFAKPAADQTNLR